MKDFFFEQWRISTIDMKRADSWGATVATVSYLFSQDQDTISTISLDSVGPISGWYYSQNRLKTINGLIFNLMHPAKEPVQPAAEARHRNADAIHFTGFPRRSHKQVPNNCNSNNVTLLINIYKQPARRRFCIWWNIKEVLLWFCFRFNLKIKNELLRFLSRFRER